MRTLKALIVTSVVALSFASSSAAQATQEFKAVFHDQEGCTAAADFCGTGLVQGFGTATTTLTLTSVTPGPGDCLTLIGVRDITLDSDGSTLALALEGVLCPNGSGRRASGSGTFTIVGGTGVFAGATGAGVVSVETTGGPTADTAKYEGTITLP